MARTIHGYPGGPAAAGGSTGDAGAEGYFVPLPSPPPPPSARRAAAPHTVSMDPAAFAPIPPMLPIAEAVAPNVPVETEATDTTDNPFQKKSRWRAWLKKPKREFMIRAAVAVVAAFVGWGVGAKPWAPSPKPRVAVNAAKAGAAAKTRTRQAASQSAPARRVASSTKGTTATQKAGVRSSTPAKTATAAKKPSQPAKLAATAKTKTATKPRATANTKAAALAKGSKSKSTKPTAKAAQKKNSVSNKTAP